VPVDAATYPVNLILDGRPVLVVGGGAVAARKLPALLECGAEVHVVAPAIRDEIKSRPGVTWDERRYEPGDVAGYRLVVAAVDDPAVSRAVRDEAEAEGVWVNSADDPTNCTFTLPSVLRRGPITVAVSTGGHSPGLAAWLRRELEADIGPEYEVLLDLLAEARGRVQREGRSTEDVDWRNALDSGILDMIKAGRVAEARERLQSWL
jgi:precorrin-2 dehydrogenase/sirohydrochlorin ferrochelatase